MYTPKIVKREPLKLDDSKNPVFFIAQHLYKFFNVETLVRIGVHTVFLKDKSKYDFGGNIVKETDDYVIFIANPKRINIDGDTDNLMDCITWERDHNEILTTCLEARKYGVKFRDDYFEHNGKKFYEIEDLTNIIEIACNKV